MIPQTVETAIQYAHEILDSKIISCELTWLAIKRHFDDLERSEETKLYFDEEAAQHAIDWFKFCRHSKGQWAGNIIELSPWQLFCTAMMFGWKNEKGFRRFRTAYIEVARKNGKSTWMSGIALYLLLGDLESGAEVYAVATKKDQAKIIFNDSVRMVKKSPELRKIIKSRTNILSRDLIDSIFKPLGQDSDTEDGLNVHGALVDELHAHKSSEMWDVMDSATGSRNESLIIAVTTAGVQRTCFCYDKRTYIANILQGVFEDPTVFGIIYTLDEEDDCFDPDVWNKANPNLGVSVLLDDMIRLSTTAKNSINDKINFLVKKLNIWVNSAKSWIDLIAWGKCKRDFSIEDLRGRTCYLGIDLSSKIDFSAVAYLFPPINNEKHWHCFVDYYYPEDNILKRQKETKVPLSVWAEQGHIKLIPGSIINYQYIEDDIEKRSEQFNIQSIGYDPYNATQLSFKLDEAGFEVKPVRQGIKTLNEPCKELEGLITSGYLLHNDNPVLNWNASCVVVEPDRNGNYLPSKGKSAGSIDGIAAIIDALVVALEDLVDEVSIYANCDEITF
ncbi:MAG: terminase large subunit [Immundisolibacteraceae bacterium]|nr:terminase large subunit [Immundisolibacteraceae bacterium]